MSDIVDTLELMARNYAYAARKLILLDASAEIQSLRMQNNALTKSLNNAARRVRWLESAVLDAAAEEHEMCCHKIQDLLLINACGQDILKPTPENFK